MDRELFTVESELFANISSNEEKKMYLLEIYTHNTQKIDRLPLVAYDIDKKTGEYQHPRLKNRQSLAKFLIKKPG